MVYIYEVQARGERRALIEELCRKEAGIMRAERAVAKINRDYERFARELAAMKNSMDQAERLLCAQDKARLEAALEIAGKMKNAGKPLSEISEFTGLSAEAIAGL